MPLRVAEAIKRKETISSLMGASTKRARGNGSPKRLTAVPDGILSGFCDVDSTDDPRSYIRYVNKVNANKVAQFTKWRLMSKILRPQKGEHILDVGCGVGHDAQELTRLVGRTGYVVGIDRSKAMIREAQRRIQHLRLPLEFRVGDAHQLDFPSNNFDGCLAVGTLMYMENPSQVLAEITRVLKPGGRCAVLEADWDTLVMTGGDPTGTNAIVKMIRQSLRQSGIGHLLPVLFRQAGFEDIAVEAGTLMLSDFALANDAWRIQATLEEAQRAGVLSSILARRWLRQLKSASKAGLFWGACTGFAVVGTKP